ncbi:MAG: HAD-IIIA family hydrolase [Bacteroidales bacterium]|nr:HAD-IIIA family hydrolase [Bacteroidales bacterium]
MMQGSPCKDNKRTLFLDRDGVLNVRPGKSYVVKPGDFHWMEGSLQALVRLTGLYARIIVVTNQQGIGKGLMNKQQLDDVHAKMLGDAQKAGARIDAVYFASGLRHSDSFNRKPSEGMFLKAKKDFPEINAGASVMVGDSFSDILFAYRLGMTSVLIAKQRSFPLRYHYMADFQFNNLLLFSDFMIRDDV